MHDVLELRMASHRVPRNRVKGCGFEPLIGAAAFSVQPQHYNNRAPEGIISADFSGESFRLRVPAILIASAAMQQPKGGDPMSSGNNELFRRPDRDRGILEQPSISR
jgi:hypothetical protein